MQNESPMMKHQDGDGYNIVQFKWETRPNSAASTAQGRPIHDKVKMVYIRSSKNQTVSHELERHFWAPDGQEPRIRQNEDLKARYRVQLDAWDAGTAEELQGTPLDRLSILDIGIIASLKEMGIHTVETLASLTDSDLFAGGRTWREHARVFIKEAEGNAPMAELIKKNENLELKVMEMEDQIKKLAAQAERKKPGPKPKGEGDG